MPNETNSDNPTVLLPWFKRHWKWVVVVATVFGLAAVFRALGQLFTGDTSLSFSQIAHCCTLVMLGLLLVAANFQIYLLYRHVEQLEAAQLYDRDRCLEVEDDYFEGDPEETAGETLNREAWSSFDQEKMERLEALVRERLSDTSLHMEQLATELHVSRRQFFRDVKRLTGHTPNAYLKAMRLSEALEGLKSGKYSTLAQAAKACGFSQIRTFTQQFKEIYKIDPSTYIKSR